MMELRKHPIIIILAVITLVIFSTIIKSRQIWNADGTVSVKRVNLTDEFLPNLVRNNLTHWPELLNIAQSSPWLFPKSRTLFPYLGLHNNLDELLEIMADRSRRIAVLAFDWHWQSMLQNNIFTLVRFARAANYIVVTGDEITLLVCIELNLPCYNASSYMAHFRRNISTQNEALINDAYHFVLLWFKIPVYLDILRKGFTIMKSDTDISYAGKDIWKVLDLMAKKSEADIVLMQEDPINAGHLYAIPNNRVIDLFEEWIASESLLKTYNEQQALAYLHGKTYMTCQSKESCNHVKTLSINSNLSPRLRNNTKESKMAAVLTYPSPFLRFGGICPSGGGIDPCDQKVLYVHPICMTSSRTKVEKLKQLGFWLMASPCFESPFNISSNVSLTRCVPIPRLWPTTENPFLKCSNSD